MHGSLAPARARYSQREQTQPVDSKNTGGVAVYLPDLEAVDLIQNNQPFVRISRKAGPARCLAYHGRIPRGYRDGGRCVGSLIDCALGSAGEFDSLGAAAEIPVKSQPGGVLGFVKGLL